MALGEMHGCISLDSRAIGVIGHSGLKLCLQHPEGTNSNGSSPPLIPPLSLVGFSHRYIPTVAFCLISKSQAVQELPPQTADPKDRWFV